MILSVLRIKIVIKDYLDFPIGEIMKTLLYFVRHGQSLGNKNRVFLGHTDLDLTDLGREQANRTAEALSRIKFDAIYSSDLIRAYNTALPHALMRGLEIKTDKRLRELYCGEWEGLTVEELIERYGEMYTVEWVKSFGCFVMPGGEGTAEGAERVYECAIDIARANPGGTVLCALHAAVLRAFYAKISGIDPSEIYDKLPYPSNASYSVVEFDGEKLVPVSYSNDDHLAELFTTWKD